MLFGGPSRWRYTIPSLASCAASTLTDPLPAPTSHTTLAGAMSSCASASERTSAGVSSPCLGVDCKKRFVRIAKHTLTNRRAWPVGCVGVTDQDHHVERLEFLRCNLFQRSACYRFVAGAKVFANVGREVVDLPIQQRLGDIRRATGVGCKEPHLLRSANSLNNGLKRLGVEAC